MAEYSDWVRTCPASQGAPAGNLDPGQSGAAGPNSSKDGTFPAGQIVPTGVGGRKVCQEPARIEAAPIERAGQRVSTLAMMDGVHGRPEGTARRAFAKHREKLSEGRHYFRAAPGTADEKRTPFGTPKGGGSHIVLLTERGYLVLVKSFRDPLAWQVEEREVEADSGMRALVAPRPERCAAAAGREPAPPTLLGPVPSGGTLG